MLKFEQAGAPPLHARTQVALRAHKDEVVSARRRLAAAAASPCGAAPPRGIARTSAEQPAASRGPDLWAFAWNLSGLLCAHAGRQVSIALNAVAPIDRHRRHTAASGEFILDRIFHRIGERADALR